MVGGPAEEPAPIMIRYRVLIASIIMTACMGATYSWNVFVGPLKELTGLGQGAIQLPFTVFYIVFPLTTIGAGMAVEKIAPRWMAVAGGLLFGAGWIVAGLGERNFIFTVIGIGGIGGAGVGLAYIVPIAMLVRWFPRSKGLVTGLAVAGFGGGAALISHAAGWLIQTRGLTPFEALGRLGWVFLAIVPLAGLCMARPAGEKSIAHHHFHLRTVLFHPVFVVLFLAFFACLMAGFTVSANLREMAAEAGPEAGVRAVAMFAIANAFGRIFWGAAFDQLSTRATLGANLVLQSGTLVLGGWMLSKTWGLDAIAAAVGFNYGGALVLYASATARQWGAERFGSVYGWMFSANIAASGAPVLAGMSYEQLGGFGWPLAVIGLTLAASAVGIFIPRGLHPGKPCAADAR